MELFHHRLRTPYNLNGMDFDSSTRHCNLMIGYVPTIHNQMRRRTSVMCIYDSKSNAWTTFVMMLSKQIIHPSGRAIYSEGMFY